VLVQGSSRPETVHVSQELMQLSANSLNETPSPVIVPFIFPEAQPMLGSTGEYTLISPLGLEVIGVPAA
jgi:hypothetical protein